MDDRETLFLLSDARRNLGQVAVLIRKITRYDPGLARVAVPRLRRLAANQNRLEVKARASMPDQNLGFPIVTAIIAGGALLGLGGYVFKHHEETSLERYKLESIDKCIEENVKAGMDRAESSRICRELFTGKNLSDTLAQLSKTITIASLAITGVWLLLRWKK